jgi:hypothetical protein
MRSWLAVDVQAPGVCAAMAKSRVLDCCTIELLNTNATSCVQLGSVGKHWLYLNKSFVPQVWCFSLLHAVEF